MKKHLRENWKYYISPTLLLCLLLAGLWYWRGVGFAHIGENLVPETVNVHVLTLSDDGQELLSANYDLAADSAEGMAVLDTLYGLTIHRPPTNLLYQILKPTRSGQMFEDGDYAFAVRVFGENGSHASLQFNVRSWSYDAADGNGYLPCSVVGKEEAGRDFGAQLWAIAEKLDCIG